MVILKREKNTITKEEALEMGLRERPFSLWEPTEHDVGNCIGIKNCLELLSIQQNESIEGKALNSIWNKIIRGGKYINPDDEILAFIKFFNSMRFLRVGERYISVIPREIPKESLAYEISLLIKFGINLGRIVRFNQTKPEWTKRYIIANKKILLQIQEVHYQASLSKQFKLYFKKRKGSRLVGVTSGSLKVDECRVDQKTLDFLKAEVGYKLLFSRDPIITVFGWTLTVVGICDSNIIEMRPETLRALCGDTDGDQIIVTKTRDTVDPNKFLPSILEYYDMQIDDMIGKCSGITNKDFLDGDKHTEWNKSLTKVEVLDRMSIQLLNLAYTKTATQRCGYWSIIVGQYISENIEMLAKELGTTIKDASERYRILLFKLQQSLTDAKHGKEDISLSLPFKLTDINLKFNNKEEAMKFLDEDDSF